MSCDFKSARIVCRIFARAAPSYSAFIYCFCKMLCYNVLDVGVVLNALF